MIDIRSLSKPTKWFAVSLLAAVIVAVLSRTAAAQPEGDIDSGPPDRRDVVQDVSHHRSGATAWDQHRRADIHRDRANEIDHADGSEGFFCRRRTGGCRICISVVPK